MANSRSTLSAVSGKTTQHLRRYDRQQRAWARQIPGVNRKGENTLVGNPQYVPQTEFVGGPALDGRWRRK